MALQPIDMQTLFSQLEKVGKMQSFAQHGVQLQHDIEQDEQARRLKEKQDAVEGTTDAGEDGPHIVKERHNSRDQEGGERKKQHETPEKPVNPQKSVISDPSLGQHIDISG